jgi:hypothetical protein
MVVQIGPKHVYGFIIEYILIKYKVVSGLLHTFYIICSAYVNFRLYLSTTSHAQLQEKLRVYVNQHWKGVKVRLHAPAALAPE